MVLLKHSAKGVSYEIPFPVEEEESANTSTIQPLSITCETKPLWLSQENVFSVQNRLKKEDLISFLVVLTVVFNIMQCCTKIPET